MRKEVPLVSEYSRMLHKESMKQHVKVSAEFEV